MKYSIPFVITLICIVLLAIVGSYSPTLTIILFSIAGLSILALFIIGITKVFDDWGKSPIVYEIKKGNHYANHIIPQCRIVKKAHSITKRFTITRSCLYHFDDNDNSVNKLWGLTFGINPLKNSVRFGWNCEKNDGTITIYMFKHISGLMVYEKIATVLPDVKYKYEIKIDDITARLYINDELKATCSINSSRFVILNKPYFGGKKTAPQDMIIIQE
jgi:hypothetical protein